MTLLHSKWFWITMAVILAALIAPSAQHTTDYPPPSAIEHSLDVPILSILNECLSFLSVHLNTSSLALLRIDSIRLEHFGLDTYQQQTVYLRSYQSAQPIPAVHNELTHIVFLNITKLTLSLFEYSANTKFSVDVDLAHTAMKRWAPIALTSAHLHALHSRVDPLDISVSEHNGIRILSINLWNFNYWQRRLPLLDEVLLRHKPDVIGVQELRIRARYTLDNLAPYEDPRLEHSFQIYDLLRRLSYFREGAHSNGHWQWFSSPAMFFKESSPEQYPEHYVGEGLGLISRFPITARHRVELSRDGNDGLDFHQRLLLGVTIEVGHFGTRRGSAHPKRLLDVYTTHLSLSRSARQRTLPEIAQYMNSQLEVATVSERKLGAVLMGDLNMETDYEESDILEEGGYHLRDVWKAKGLCAGDGVQPRKSYNFRNREMRHVWDDAVHPMFESPNTHFLRHAKRRKKIPTAAWNSKTKQSQSGRHLNEMNEIAEVAVNVPLDHDLEAWNEFVYQGRAEEEEWWRDGRCSAGWTFNSWDLKKRIDYFYVNEELLQRVRDIRIVGREVNRTIVGLEPVGGVHDMADTLYPSDHRFLYLDIDVSVDD